MSNEYWSTEPEMAFAVDGLCRQVDLDLWFPTKTNHVIESRRAKAICGQCPVLTECATYAMTAFPRVEGIWGGMSKPDRDKRRAAGAA